MGYQKRHAIRDILDLQDRMNRVFEESMRDTGLSQKPGHCNPPVDVFEDDQALYVRVELPGVKRDDILIDYSDGVLTISGKKPFSRANQKNESYYMIERQYGSFRRSLSLSYPVDGSTIQARFESGVLEIVFPKAHGERSRKIPITVK